MSPASFAGRSAGSAGQDLPSPHFRTPVAIDLCKVEKPLTCATDCAAAMELNYLVSYNGLVEYPLIYSQYDLQLM